MITRDKLPKSYTPYSTLTVCSNILLGGSNILAIGKVLPILVGKGEKPQVWLQARSDPKNSKFVTIVEASISKHPAVKVFEDNNVLNISVAGTNILSVKASDENSAEILLLDLRPLGLNVYGNESQLQAGGSTFTQNTFSGGGTLIAFRV